MYKLRFTKRAQKDAEKGEAAGFKAKICQLLKVIEQNPFQNPPPYEKLIGDLQGMYSRRINIQHRLIYAVFSEEKTIKVLSLWSHYE